MFMSHLMCFSSPGLNVECLMVILLMEMSENILLEHGGANPHYSKCLVMLRRGFMINDPAAAPALKRDLRESRVLFTQAQMCDISLQKLRLRRLL